MTGREADTELLKGWEGHMRAGDFESAWRISDRLQRSPSRFAESRPPHLRSVWRGAPLENRPLLIRCHHGLGDTLQFIRYTELLRPRVQQLTLAAQPELECLLGSAVRGIDRIVPACTPARPSEVELEIMELPYALRTTCATIPAQVPYIHVERIERKVGPVLQVGIVWGAGDWDRARSIPPEFLGSLSRLPAISWHILQRGRALEDRPSGFGVLAGSDDVLLTARTIRSLDLVISVDSMPAHLAGALGVPVWTLLRAHADWRWMEARNDTPWYPTMRLFRQQQEGDWAPVIDHVLASLQEWAASRTGQRIHARTGPSAPRSRSRPQLR